MTYQWLILQKDVLYSLQNPNSSLILTDACHSIFAHFVSINVFNSKYILSFSRSFTVENESSIFTLMKFWGRTRNLVIMAVQGIRANSEIPRIPYSELALEEFQVCKSWLIVKEKKRHGVQPTFHNSRLFFCIFPMNFAMATLGLKEMGKFLWEGREKSLPSWLSQFSFAKLRQPTRQTFFPTFPKEFFHFLQT